MTPNNNMQQEVIIVIIVTIIYNLHLKKGIIIDTAFLNYINLIVMRFF